MSPSGGKGRTGWHTSPRSPGRWRVDGSALVADEGPGFLFTDGGSHEFHPRAEARISAVVNCRDSLRAGIGGEPRTPSGSLPRLGYQKAVSSTPPPHGSVPSDARFTLGVRAAAGEAVTRSSIRRPAPDWGRALPIPREVPERTSWALLGRRSG